MLRSDGSNPSDVPCRVHYFKIREKIMRQAWHKGKLPFDGVEISLLPDLSPVSTDPRNVSSPPLYLLGRARACYTWGYLLHLLVHRNNVLFTFHKPAQIRNLLQFLEVCLIFVPDWLSVRLPLLPDALPQRPLLSTSRRRIHRKNPQVTPGKTSLFSKACNLRGFFWPLCLTTDTL